MTSALQELEETQYWFELFVESDLLPAARLANLRDEYEQLVRIFVTIINHARDHRR